MQVKILTEVLTFQNDKKIISTIYDEINRICLEKNLEISHLIIDGEMIDKDYQLFFQEHIQTIDEVIVVVASLEMLVTETIGSAYEYVSSNLKGIETLAESFYGKTDSQAWKQLANLFEGIEWLLNIQVRIDQIKNLSQLIKDYLVWNEVVLLLFQLKDQILTMNEAMQNSDLVLIGDLLKYEILPLFKNLEIKLRLLVSIGEKDYVS
ncbi:MAG: hypothetical protein ABGU93_04030 [Acetobacterium sp.]|uniref:hypothetical protein n=1 Tax=Acetobacterium sp. TaxID=1872094 RepID=UPI0032422E78